MILVIYVVSLVITITVMHELLHIVGYQLFGIPWKLKIICKRQIPIAFAVDSEYFAGTFRNLNKFKQAQYTIIAGFPYLIIFPLCVYMGNQIPVIGWGFGVAHMINWPLEYGI
jgi:hypothetical protein